MQRQRLDAHEEMPKSVAEVWAAQRPRDRSGEQSLHNGSFHGDLHTRNRDPPSHLTSRKKQLPIFNFFE